MSGRKDYKKLTEEDIKEICKVFQHREIASLAREYGTSITQMTGIYSVCIHEMKLNKALRERFPECRYYDTEQDIFNALELKYEPSDLKGWELEQYNKR